MTREIHDLTPGYALNALDEADERAYEEHLAHCDRCQEELAELSGAAASLAFAAEPAEPPAALRDRILESARAERPNVVPLRPRWAYPVVAVAAVAASIALVFGLWANSLNNRVNKSTNITAFGLDGANGSLIVDGAGHGTLVLTGTSAAPSGKTYEAWVIDGDKVTRAGLFQGGGDTVQVSLDESVPKGAVVGVTVERAGGVDQPTSSPIITSKTV